MLKVSEILRVKGHTLYTATPETPIKQALETMAEQDIGSLVIMEHGELVGMVTFREIIRHLHGNTSAEEVQRLMLDKHARYMPVMDGPVLLGVISFYDMAQAIVAAQRFENNMLKAYIRDWPTELDEENNSTRPPKH